MNASNIPLNDEEQRNARFQGAFKWFIQSVGKKYSQALAIAGLLGKRDIIRMVDTKNYAEIVHTIENGFVTVKAAQIDSLYKKYNVEFDREDEFWRFLEYGLDTFLSAEYLHQNSFLKHHIFHSIVLVLINRHFGLGLEVKALDIAELSDGALGDGIDLSVLLAALGDPEEFPQLFQFVEASSKGTNVAKAKAIRFAYFNHVI